MPVLGPVDTVSHNFIRLVQGVRRLRRGLAVSSLFAPRRRLDRINNREDLSFC
jgi:hypothetical protein